LQLGICGGHGGESESIQFFHSIGLVYVCGSPFRVPRARLSSAHAYLSD
jgi:pyruvate,orthophosphate dikinase